MKTIDGSIHWAEAAAIYYVTAPTFLFLAFFVRIFIAIPACLFIAFCTYSVAKNTDWGNIYNVNGTTFFVLALSIVWVILSGNLGVLYQNYDWIKHYSILNYLTSNPWPAEIRLTGTTQELAVRYSIGWYLVPAFVMKYGAVFDPKGISGLWSLLGIYLFFRMLIGTCATKRAMLIVPLVFVLFSGADFIGSSISHFGVGPRYHIEWWSGWLQYGSNTTGLFWAPQHALASWLGLILLYRQWERPTALPYIGLVLGALMLWSSFAVIGLAPFALALIGKYGTRRLMFDWRALASMPLVIVPVGLYLTSHTAELPHGFIASSYNRCIWPDSPCFSATSYLLFVMIEFALPALILLTVKQRRSTFLYIAIVMLLCIPFYKLGRANDFAMRVSMSSIAMLAIACGQVLSNGPRLQVVTLAAVLALGLPTVAGEMIRPFVEKPFISERQNLAESLNMQPEVLPQYFAALPVWILRHRIVLSSPGAR